MINLTNIIIFLVYAMSTMACLWLAFQVGDYRKWLYAICGISFGILTAGVFLGAAVTMVGLITLVIASSLHAITRSIEVFADQKGFCIKKGRLLHTIEPK